MKLVIGLERQQEQQQVIHPSIIIFDEHTRQKTHEFQIFEEGEERGGKEKEGKEKEGKQKKAETPLAIYGSDSDLFVLTRTHLHTYDPDTFASKNSFAVSYLHPELKQYAKVEGSIAAVQGNSKKNLIVGLRSFWADDEEHVQYHPLQIFNMTMPLKTLETRIELLNFKPESSIACQQEAIIYFSRGRLFKTNVYLPHQAKEEYYYQRSQEQYEHVSLLTTTDTPSLLFGIHRFHDEKTLEELVVLNKNLEPEAKIPIPWLPSYDSLTSVLTASHHFEMKEHALQHYYPDDKVIFVFLGSRHGSLSVGEYNTQTKVFRKLVYGHLFEEGKPLQNSAITAMKHNGTSDENPTELYLSMGTRIAQIKIDKILQIYNAKMLLPKEIRAVLVDEITVGVEVYDFKRGITSFDFMRK